MAEKDIYWQMYADVWAFHKRYINSISDDDSFWEEIVVESGKLSKKYGECKFIIDLMIAEITEFERIYKEVKANAET